MAVIIIAAIIIVLGPLSLVWALNILFHTGLAFNIETWLAAVVLILIFSRSYLSFTRRK